MVVWEDRGVLKLPKPSIVHATGVSDVFSSRRRRAWELDTPLNELMHDAWWL